MLMEHPEIIAEALMAKPQVLYEVLAKIAPWERLATKEDIARVEARLDALVERVEALENRVESIEQKMATKEDFQRFATREDLEKLATKDDLKRLATKEDLEKFATKEDLQRFATKEDLERFVTKEGLEEFANKYLERLKEIFVTREEFEKFKKWIKVRFDALGARWGVGSEEAFREGVRELLKDAGFAAERWAYYDADGYVYGYPAEVELDVVVHDDKTIVLEITSTLKRGDLPVVKRKAELYERATGRRVDAVYVIAVYIHDRNPALVEAVANKMGIRLVKPESFPGEAGEES